MPTAELNPNDPRLLAITLLLTALVVGGASAWEAVWRRQRDGRPWLDWCDELRDTWHQMPQSLALLLALLWFGLHLGSHLVTDVSPEPITLSKTALVRLIALSGGTTLLLALLLASSGQQWGRAFGLKWSPLASQLRDGAFGFLLAILPMAATMLLTTPLRTHDTQNALLRMLSDSPDAATIALIVVIAAIIAPLSEEMIFRVLLQGWLITVMPERIAILIVAIAFCMVHGPVDGLALLPLALILGYVFHRRHSYIAVVVIHSLFNATMLTLSLLSSP